MARSTIRLICTQPEADALFGTLNVKNKLVRRPNGAHTAREEEHVVLRDWSTSHALGNLDFATDGALVPHEHACNAAAQSTLRQLGCGDVEISSIALLKVYSLVRFYYICYTGSAG